METHFSKAAIIESRPCWRKLLPTILLFSSVCLILSMVLVTTPDQPSGETVGQWTWLGKVMPFSAGLILLAALLQWQGKVPWKEIVVFRHYGGYVSVGLMIFGAIEAVWGVLQLYGFITSGHSGYALTGSFYNPGPYAGYLAMVLPICVFQYTRCGFSGRNYLLTRYDGVLGLISGVLILCVLPATMSRAAWVSAAVGCLLVVYLQRNRRKWNILWRRYKRKYIGWGIGVGILLGVLLTAMVWMKHDSALGRLFIWKMTTHAIVEAPLNFNKSFAERYNNAQSAYFFEGDYAPWEERVAGSPTCAFNEYLDGTMAIGVIGMTFIVVFILINVVVAFDARRNGIFGAIISFLIFAFFSYPMHIPAFAVAFCMLLLACGLGDYFGKYIFIGVAILLLATGFTSKCNEKEEACREWANIRTLYKAGAYEAAAEAYKELYPRMKEKGEFLFECGHSLHKIGKYKESNQYLNEALNYCTDPMVLNIIGKNYEAMKQYLFAEECYVNSSYILPGRIYPYYLLAKLYALPEYISKKYFEKMKRIVLEKIPKVHSTAIEEMREELLKLEVTDPENGLVREDYVIVIKR